MATDDDARPGESVVDAPAQRVLKAAGELISEGTTRMTLAEVGERAGYSKGIVTVKFGSKQGLLAAVVEGVTTEWSVRRWLPEVERLSGLEGFLLLIRGTASEFDHDPRKSKLFHVLLFEALRSNPELREQFVAFHRSLRVDLGEILRRGVQDGSIRPDISIVDEAAALISALRGIGYQWIIDPDDFAPAAALDHLERRTAARLRTRR